MKSTSSTLEELQAMWAQKSAEYWDELSGIIQEEIRRDDKFAVTLRMVVDGKRVKFSASVPRAGVKATPQEATLDDQNQRKLGLEAQN